MNTTEKTAKKYNKQVEFRRTTQTVRMGLLKNLPADVSQRPINENWVNQIFQDFDPDKMQVPHVSHREGYYWIMDGQHTVEGLKRFLGEGWQDQNLKCEVYEGLAEKDEANQFIALNSKKAVPHFSLYKAGITAGKPDETEIEKILSTRGLVSTTQQIPGAIAAVGTLTRTFRRDGGAALNRALKLAYEAYGDPGLEAVVIDGFSMMCHRYNGVLDETKSIQCLSGLKGGVKGLLGLAEQLRLKTGGRKAECVAASAVTIINRDRGGKSKLPSWFK